MKKEKQKKLKQSKSKLTKIDDLKEIKNIDKLISKERIRTNKQLSNQFKSMKDDNSNNKDDSIMRSIKVTVYPTKDQQIVIDQLFGINRWYYNRCIDWMEKNKKYGRSEAYKGLQLETNKFENPEWCKFKVPSRIIDAAINDCSKAYKSAFELLNRGYISFFKMQQKTKKDKKQSIMLHNGCFSTNINIKNNLFSSVYPNFGELKGYIKRNKRKINLSKIHIFNDCRLVYDGFNYALIIPISKNKNKLSSIEKQDTDKSICFGDAGIRTPISLYDPKRHITVDVGHEASTKLYRLFERINNNQSKYDLTKRIKYLKNKRRLERQITNMIADMHWKIINFMVSNWDVIVISDFKTASILKLKYLAKITKRVLTSLSHFTFQQRLKSKCEEKGKTVLFVNEAYTSKTCCQCGTLNHTLGASKVFNCNNCGLFTDRDWNGAVNIANKNMDQYPLIRSVLE